MAGDDEELDDLLNAIEQGAGIVKVYNETNLFQKCFMQRKYSPAIHESSNLSFLWQKTKKRKVEDLGSDEEGPAPKYKGNVLCGSPN